MSSTAKLAATATEITFAREERNANNTVEQSKMIARMTSGSSISVDTLETTWRTIVNGIDETRQIQADARKKRAEDQVRLENIKQEFNSKYSMPANK